MSSELSYSSIKISQHVRDAEEKKVREKKRQILYLVSSFLKGEGYFETERIFNNEAQLTSQYEICDNIDLANIVQEYELYYHLRFQKYPKICKKVSPSSEDRKSSSPNVSTCASAGDVKRSNKHRDGKQGISKSASMPSQNSPTRNTKEKNLCDNELTVISCNLNSINNKPKVPEDITERILKPLGAYAGLTGEWREYAEIISKEICMTNLNTRWSDIMGLDEAKRLLKEAVVYPIKYPELFSGILAPWKGLLLYGPSGTGKTLLAKAVATECNTTFFNISASSIVSKWRGDSEKLVRVMFELARYHAPSTIFLDELDALASHRDGSVEHEGSRRLKSELLIQLDGLSQSDEKVFLLATSNLPWELDVAMLRRLEKRILVDLPNTNAREAMFQHYLPPLVMKQPKLRCDLNYKQLAMATAGYSGSDIKLVCKEAAMAAMRQAFAILESHDTDSKLPSLDLNTITTSDIEMALTKTQPSAAHLSAKYQKWQKDFGSV